MQFAKSIITLMAIFGVSIFHGPFAERGDEKKPKKISRVKRPDLKSTSRSEIYFDDIFSEGLVGPPPPVAIDSGQNQPPAEKSAENAWSRIISRDAIEDEIKLLHQEMQTSVVSPSGFSTRYQQVRRQFELLALLFGIVHEYDQPIRWKKYAGSYQLRALETAVKVRTPSRSAFESAKDAKEELSELVRGGGVPVKDDLPSEVSWSDVADRRSMMIELESLLQENLKPATADENQFASRKDEILRLGNLTSAMARVLTEEGMDEWDEDGYADFARDMGAAARQLLLATQGGEFQEASKAVNRIEQSCTDCHSEWR